MKTRTKGDVIVEDIKIGDIHYEYFGSTELKTTVMTLPVKEEREDDNYWRWTSVTDNDVEINYGVSDKHSHYGPNLYTYKAYINFNEVPQGDLNKD